MKFWLAIDDTGRVVGCVGYSSLEGSSEVRLRRLYVKASLKRRGIGTLLLKTAVIVHLGGKGCFESRSFYPKHGYREFAPDDMRKEL